MAIRPSSTEIRGVLTTESGIRMTYEGSLNDGNHIDGFLIAGDGTGCAVSPSQGLIP
jgi:hypothetical protein